MSRQSRSPYIHKHLHYHYHYDASQVSASSLQYVGQGKTPRQSQLLSEYSSWKNHINPEVTRLYEEMSETDPRRETDDPRTSGNYQEIMAKNNYNYQNDQSNYTTHSRRNLLHNIQQYQQYLKQRQLSNSHTPNTVSFIKHQEYPYNQNVQQDKYLSVRQMNRNGKSLEDIVRKKADSKIFYPDKMYEATTARDEETEYGKQQEMIHLLGRDVRVENVMMRSEIKRPKNHFVVENAAKMGLSQIKPTTLQNNQYNKNSNQYQPANFQQSFNQINQPHYQENKFYQQQYSLLPKQNTDSYKYQLMKEECEYLRSKFIQHIGIIHGVKF